MTFTRRDLLKGMFNPAFWTGATAAPGPAPPPPEIPAGQDIVLAQDRCIAWGKGVCDRCDVACSIDAIVTVGMLHPRILPHRCTLCGDCVPICPTQAIAIRPGAGPRTGGL